MRAGILVTGMLFLVVGLVWIGQGANLIGGSFMTGQSMWLEIGVGVALLGAALVWWGAVGHRRSRR